MADSEYEFGFYVSIDSKSPESCQNDLDFSTIELCESHSSSLSPKFLTMEYFVIVRTLECLLRDLSAII
ncbi:hypothetical protein RIF29_20309 [Crotalaria pallida]|uniref:Uncharacterized protein n=1 Tax=Crotalaria pallida TaxID=3830 RepID=A0AAN9F483_CROPI